MANNNQSVLLSKFQTFHDFFKNKITNNTTKGIWNIKKIKVITEMNVLASNLPNYNIYCILNNYLIDPCIGNALNYNVINLEFEDEIKSSENHLGPQITAIINRYMDINYLNTL